MVGHVRKSQIRSQESDPEPCDSCAEVCVGGVPELFHQRMALEHLLDDAPLYTFAATVDQANLAQPCLVRRADVFVDDRRDVPRGERMKVQRALDRDAVRHGAQAAL